MENGSSFRESDPHDTLETVCVHALAWQETKTKKKHLFVSLTHAVYMGNNMMANNQSNSFRLFSPSLPPAENYSHTQVH